MMGKHTFPSAAAGGEEDRLLTARTEELLAAAADYAGGFLGFLDPREKTVAQRVLQRAGGSATLFWGGYAQAERVMLGAFAPGAEPRPEAFPITAIEIRWRFARLTHRDFLGALLALGVVRGKIGDILVGDGQCTVFAEKAVAPFLASNLRKVGSAGVSCALAEDGGAQAERQDRFRDLRDTIASQRLDCVAAALTGLSRTDAAKLVRDGLVSVNFEPRDAVSFQVEEGASLSIRGYGRFLVDRIGPATKKGRLAFAARKFL